MKQTACKCFAYYFIATLGKYCRDDSVCLDSNSACIKTRCGCVEGYEEDNSVCVPVTEEGIITYYKLKKKKTSQWFTDKKSNFLCLLFIFIPLVSKLFDDVSYTIKGARLVLTLIS